MDWNLGVAARTLWQEARGEPQAGQIAVAHAIVNRLKSGRWGKTLGEVCLWHMQFSGWRNVDPNFALACELHDDDPQLVAFANLITQAFTESDPTSGAEFYYADTIEPPIWTNGASYCGKFGSQLFFCNVK